MVASNNQKSQAGRVARPERAWKRQSGWEFLFEREGGFPNLFMSSSRRTCSVAQPALAPCRAGLVEDVVELALLASVSVSASSRSTSTHKKRTTASALAAVQARPPARASFERTRSASRLCPRAGAAGDFAQSGRAHMGVDLRGHEALVAQSSCTLRMSAPRSKRCVAKL